MNIHPIDLFRVLCKQDVSFLITRGALESLEMAAQEQLLRVVEFTLRTPGNYALPLLRVRWDMPSNTRHEALLARGAWEVFTFMLRERGAVKFYDISCKTATLAWTALPAAPPVMGAGVSTLTRFPLPLSCAKHFMSGKKKRYLMVPLDTARCAGAVRSLVESEDVETQRIFCAHKRLWCMLGQDSSRVFPASPDWTTKPEVPVRRRRNVWYFKSAPSPDTSPLLTSMNLKFYGSNDRDDSEVVTTVQAQEYSSLF